jgi:hypothetical protein
MSFIKARPRARHDFYSKVHKGLRLAESQLLVRLGACDGQDPDELTQLMADMVGFMAMAEHHLENEDRWIHTALEARAPGAAGGLAQGHLHHRRDFDELEALIGGIETQQGAARAKALQALYLRFTRYVAEDFLHMSEEEQLILPVLQSLFTDAELIAIEHDIVAALSPEQAIDFARLMIPASNPSERLEWVGGLREAAPPEAFAAVMALAAQPTLSACAFARLREGLGLAAEAG